jgi:hypothetical protein
MDAVLSFDLQLARMLRKNLLGGQVSDGTHLAGGNFSGSVTIWDIETGEEHHPFMVTQGLPIPSVLGLMAPASQARAVMVQ